MEDEDKDTPLKGMASAPKGGRSSPLEGSSDSAGPADTTGPRGADKSASFPSWMSPVQVRSPALDGSGAGERYDDPPPEAIVETGKAAAPGVLVTNEPAHVYHTWKRISASWLKDLANSPVAFYERNVAGTAPPRAGKALDYGTLVHTWAELGDERFFDQAKLIPKQHLTATGALSKAGDQWAKEQPAGSLLITPADHEKLYAQTRQILANAAARELLEAAVAQEFNVRWDWNGHPMRCRSDGATDSVWFDLKTTRDLKPLDTFWSSVRDYNYGIQAAVYENAMVAAGWSRAPLHFIATSTLYPYHCSVVTLPESLTRSATQRCLALLEELAHRSYWESWLPEDYGQVTELKVPAFMLGEEGVWREE